MADQILDHERLRCLRCVHRIRWRDLPDRGKSIRTSPALPRSMVASGPDRFRSDIAEGNGGTKPRGPCSVSSIFRAARRWNARQFRDVLSISGAIPEGASDSMKAELGARRGDVDSPGDAGSGPGLRVISMV